MPECIHSSNPDACLKEHRTRLLKLKHQWDRIPCQECPSSRPNAIAAFVPEPDTDPHKGKHGIRRCSDCGTKIDRRNMSGTCKYCQSLYYSDDKHRRRHELSSM